MWRLIALCLDLCVGTAGEEGEKEKEIKNAFEKTSLVTLWILTRPNVAFPRDSAYISLGWKRKFLDATRVRRC